MTTLNVWNLSFKNIMDCLYFSYRILLVFILLYASTRIVCLSTPNDNSQISVIGIYSICSDRTNKSELNQNALMFH